MSRYLLTATLLNSWMYCLGSGDLDDFMKCLRREPIRVTEAMKRGNEFEAWAYENIEEVKGGVHQAALYAEIPGYLLYGKIDCLRSGTIYDIKYTSKYDAGKYYGSPQTSMYFALVPEAMRFTYIIGCDDQIFRETYLRNEAEDIRVLAWQFDNWLAVNRLKGTYQEHWRAAS